MAEKDKLENISGSGITINIKGKEYKLGIWGVRDLADFRQYIKAQRIKVIQDTINNEDERIKIIDNILDKNIKEIEELSTMDGVCFMLWRSLQKYQPEITLDEVDKLVDINNIKEISNVIQNLGGKIENPPVRTKVKN